MRTNSVASQANGDSPYKAGKRVTVKDGDWVSKIAEEALSRELVGGKKPTREQIAKATELIVKQNEATLKDALEKHPDGAAYKDRPLGDFITPGMTLEMPDLYAQVLLKGETMKLRNGQLVKEPAAEEAPKNNGSTSEQVSAATESSGSSASDEKSEDKGSDSSSSRAATEEKIQAFAEQNGLQYNIAETIFRTREESVHEQNEEPPKPATGDVKARTPAKSVDELAKMND